nr:hypothetical protein [Tanacetum cinerariifolium]
LPASPTYPLGYRAAMIQLRAKIPSTSHPLPSGTPPSGTPLLLPIPLPTPSLPLILPSTSHRSDVTEGASATDETELGRRMTNFVTTVRQDIDEVYVRLDDAHDDRSLISERVNLLYRDRRDHAQTARLMETRPDFHANNSEVAGTTKGPAQPDAPEEAGSSS